VTGTNAGVIAVRPGRVLLEVRRSRPVRRRRTAPPAAPSL